MKIRARATRKKRSEGRKPIYLCIQASVIVSIKIFLYIPRHKLYFALSHTYIQIHIYTYIDLMIPVVTEYMHVLVSQCGGIAHTALIICLKLAVRGTKTLRLGP